jgi:hypothetical protein
MLTEERILQNKNFFLEKNKEYNILPVELINFLGDDLFIAPATTSKDMYYAYPGGLISFIINVSKNTTKINTLLDENLRLSVSSILKCIFISQIGKTFLFKLNTNDWQVKNMGKNYEFNSELLPIKYTERSLYYAINNNIKFEEYELNAILNLENDENKSYKNILLNIIKMGIEMTLLNEKNKK